MTFPLSVLASHHPQQEHAYQLQDIDKISTQLGIPWQLSKDIPFAKKIIFIGFEWDLEEKTVTLSESKVIKYNTAIKEWKQKHTHTLEKLQKLYRKLIHASNIFPQGQAYLTSLEAMFPIFGNKPFKPCTPPCSVPQHLNWWAGKLGSSHIPQNIPMPLEVFDT
ncbi:hypothetical protein APHAL10511_000846 [Amanita phalloides]|nr:hypothetical protein APHAL10511_000846 [Amanita phalloides]